MIIHHHLGLGDHLVCNGLVNYIQTKENIYIDLICKKCNLETIEYLYSENDKIKIIGIDGLNEILEVNYYAYNTNQRILRIGFEYCDLKNWDRSFYRQLNIPFIERYRFFKLPQKKPEKLLQVPNESYLLIHNQTSEKSYDLNISSNMLKVYINKQEGYHLLSYIDLILNAKEIHCVDSSVFHLVDSLPNITNKLLYYHDIRKSPCHFEISSKWRVINY